jgi:Asp-tRNA(Asn)/Glu-tRNA(Gln) amidotransferase A subunit family amidase
MPLSLSFAAGSFNEAGLFRVAHAYERAAGWWEKRPPLAM